MTKKREAISLKNPSRLSTRATDENNMPPADHRIKVLRLLLSISSNASSRTQGQRMDSSGQDAQQCNGQLTNIGCHHVYASDNSCAQKRIVDQALEK